MSPDQHQWFQDGSGCNGAASCWMTAANLLTLAQMVAVVAVITFIAWTCMQAYENWANEEIKSGQMIFIWARAVFVLLVMLFLIIN